MVCGVLLLLRLTHPDGISSEELGFALKIIYQVISAGAAAPNI
jgi:hypothetical protein